MRNKTCTGCGRSKPLQEFYKRKDRKSGVTSKCKECLYTEIKAHRLAHSEKVRASQKKHHDANRDKYNRLDRERYAKTGYITKQEYNDMNREKINANQRAYNISAADTIRDKKRA